MIKLVTEWIQHLLLLAKHWSENMSNSFKKHNCLITVLLFVLAMSWIVWETFVTEFLMNFFFSRWIQACINEDLPPTTELEEGLRNGVFLAKLGHFFAQSVVPIKRIYDKDQTRYHVSFNIFLCCFRPPPPKTNYDTSGNKWLHLLLSFVAVSLLICTEYEKIIIIINLSSLEWCHRDTNDFPSKKKILS